MIAHSTAVSTQYVEHSTPNTGHGQEASTVVTKIAVDSAVYSDILRYYIAFSKALDSASCAISTQ